MGETRFCKACENIKYITDFHKDSRRPDGYRDRCKICVKNSIPIPSFENKTCRICNKCHIVKDIDNFTYGNKLCKICLNSKRRNLYPANRESIIQKVKEYGTKNKDRINSATRKRYKLKSRQDSIYKLNHNIKSLIKQSFKNKDFKKNSKTNTILGCSTEEFKRHIEFQFLPWMTWDNHGNCETNEYNCTWHLDHIIPISFAKTENEIYLLNHWSNFQPLCSKVNTGDKSNNIYPVTNLELNITIEDKQIIYNE